MNVFIARQPIFTSRKKTFGYELLFRMGSCNAFPDVNKTEATSNLMSNLFSSFDFSELLNQKPGFINFTQELILQKVPLLLPSHHFVIEVLEDVAPEPEVVLALSQLKAHGFVIALDDFVYHERFHPMLALSKIIKFDLKETPLQTLPDIIKKLQADYHLTLLAEKVESYEEFDQAKEMGFQLFQGYFFSKPEVLSKKGIAPNQMTKLKLINELRLQDLDLPKIESLIKEDVSISFKLFKFMNSAYFNRPHTIDTIKDAMTYLGENELKKFISVIVLSDLCCDKPEELIRAAVVRARLCERIGVLLKTKYTGDELFILGLFSFMDAILDRKMEAILFNMAFSDKMKSALLGNEKEFRILLNLISIIEKGHWGHAFFSRLSSSPFNAELPDFYFDSIKMADALVNG